MTLKPADVERIAKETGVSIGAVEAIASAMAHSEGAAAQFNHPELGGMGQWMSGGMLMIGDMFNHELKAKVDRVCRAVAAAIVSLPSAERRSGSEDSHASWWPQEFGRPGSVGSQNAMRYAIFPSTKRLVIDDNGAVSIYNGKYVLTGVSQQQSTTQALSFSSSEGPVALSKLKRIKTAERS